MVIEIKEKLDNNGFSIIEVLVSIFIITVGMVSITTLVTQNIQVQYVNKNNLIASQLAQEGLEMVRNIRDRNWRAQNYYNSGIVNPGFTKNFAIYTDTQALVDVVDISDPRTNIKLCDSGIYSGYYGCQVGAQTVFNRMASTTVNTIASSTVVSCIVEWKERGNVRRYIADTELYDWVQ